MIKSLILGLLGVLAAALLYVAYYTGAFKSVRIDQGKAGPFLVLAKEHFGAYHKIVPVIEEVETWVKKHGGDCSRSFGQYFDDPESVEQERLRSRGGCILAERIPGAPDDFKWDEIPEKMYVKAVFEGSPGIGPLKVYPKVDDFMRERNLTPNFGVMEVYVIHGPKEMTTTYYFPYSSQ